MRLYVRKRNPFRNKSESLERIEVVLRGGLGNQLFQFASGAELARRLRLPLHLLTSFLPAASTPRRFELGQIVEGVATWGEESTCRHIYRERGLPYEPRFEHLSSSVILDGYFQTSKYFGRTKDFVSQRIRGASDFQEGRKSVRGDFISVQVRRGDYVKPEEAGQLGTVPLAFFRESVDLVRRIVGDLPLLIFSDDQDTAEQFSESLAYANPHSPTPGDSPLKTLGSLSAGVAFCISNSSFGWWAAFMRAGSGPVIAPRPWFAGQSFDSRDVVEPDWLTLGSSGPSSGN